MSIQITNVLLLDNVDPSAKVILEENGINATICKEKLSQADLIKKLQDFDGVVVRSATKITSDIIEQCPNLKIVGRAGVGVDNVDIKCATGKGVIVMNTPSGNTLSAAEHTCTLICCLSRNVPAADASMKAGKWDRKAFMGHELYGKTLGIIGLGRIGREAAIRMQSFGMTTIGYDPLVLKDEAAQYNIEWMEVEEIWPKADYITVHVPLIPQTKGLLNDTSFAKCKKGVRVVNCARGGVIDEDALLRALESGQCGGAGLDVYVEEPTTNFALVKHPKVVACPHLGASTVEGQARCGKEIAEQFVDVARGKSFFGVLNAPALSQSTGLQTWISTMICLGKTLRSFFATPPGQIKIEASGNELKKAGRCLQAALCVGYLQSDDSSINLINSSVAAAAKDISVTFSAECNAIAGFQSSCSVTAVGEVMSIRIIGTALGNRSLLLGVDSSVFSLPLPLEGNMVLVKCQESSLTTVLGDVLKLGGAVTSLSTTPAKSGAQWVALATLQNILNKNLSSVVPGAVSIQF